MRKILIADDDAGLRALLDEILSGAGYKTVVAKDGLEAWNKLQREGADLAVLDYNMPEMDGLQLTAKIRGDERHKTMPVMVLTVRDFVEDQVAGYDSGADDYLTKPFESAVLLARLKVLERRILKKGP